MLKLAVHEGPARLYKVKQVYHQKIALIPEYKSKPSAICWR